MRPALYYPWVYLKGGAERMMLELMRRSRHDWTLYTNHYEPASTFPELADMRIVELARVSVRRSVVDVARAGLTLLTQRLDLSGHEALIVVSEGLGNLVASRSNVPTSCICLTPLKIAYDPYSRAQRFRGLTTLHQRLAVDLYARIERHAWRRYRRVFCNSAETMRRVLGACLAARDDVEVAYHGVDIEHFVPSGEREPVFLVPGRVMWTKRIELAIHSWLLFKPAPSTNECTLMIAGMVDAKSRAYADSLHALAGGREDIRFVESPSDGELLRLYQRCHAVVFPAPNEDWGLVPLEGMACGKPVLATDRGGPRESVLDGETGFLRPDTPLEFAEALRTLAQMAPGEYARMSGRARERARAFTWDHFVSRVDDHVEEIGGLIQPHAGAYARRR